MLATTVTLQPSNLKFCF